MHAPQRNRHCCHVFRHQLRVLTLAIALWLLVAGPPSAAAAHVTSDAFANRFYSSVPPPNSQAHVDSGMRRLVTKSGATWLALEGLLGHVRSETFFVDTTDSDVQFPDPATPLARSDSSPATLAVSAVRPLDRQLQATLSQLNANVSTAFLAHWLTTYTQLINRYPFGSYGFHASQDLHRMAFDLAKAKAASGVRVTVEKFKHPGMKQYTVIARIEKDQIGNTQDDPIVVIGSNLDSFNLYDPIAGISPGANENGSGCATLYEVYRVILTTGVVPQRPIEFHWYAASAQGRIGSQQVVAQYHRLGVRVAAMLQVARTGWDPSTAFAVEKRVGVATDYVDPGLSRILKELVAGEGFLPVDRECGFACSDHFVWHAFGYPAGFILEAERGLESPYAHQVSDTVETVSFVRMKKFVNVVLKLIVRMCF